MEWPFRGREGHRIDPLSQISMSCFRLVDCNVDVKSTKVEMDDSIRASTDESADEMPATQPSERYLRLLRLQTQIQFARQRVSFCSRSAKRQHISSISSESSLSGSFVITKSAKSRGRSNVRKTQDQADRKTANCPWKRTANQCKGDSAYAIYRSVPKTKKAIASIYTPAECNNDIRFVFPRQFVEKAQVAVTAGRMDDN
ncbi:hypothetical protein GQ600_20498 [Phytophthora cactorum]|nr:hypothetical protein GQ600_20498 [Phytophthora cactorum]